jgi:dUTP pyrophosphatase
LSVLFSLLFYFFSILHPLPQPHWLLRTPVDIQPCATTMSFQVRLLTPTAQPPKRGSVLAAGYDAYASEPTTIPANGRALVSTGLAVVCPPDTYVRVAPRSGLAVKNGISTGAGVIDADYRGEVKVLLFNHSTQDFTVNAGDRIAQLIIERIITPQVEVLNDEQWETVCDTTRGAGGFGSTGN